MARLGLLGWNPIDAVNYSRQYVMRSYPSLVEVDENCPRVTRDDLVKSNPANSGRLVSVDYRINVDDLGYLSDSTEFEELLKENVKLIGDAS